MGSAGTSARPISSVAWIGASRKLGHLSPHGLERFRFADLCGAVSGLMEKDEMSNLGFHEEDTKPKTTPLSAKGPGSAGDQGQPERERATMARIV